MVVDSVGNYNGVGNTPDIVAAFCLELRVNVWRYEKRQDLFDDVVHDAINDDW